MNVCRGITGGAVACLVLMGTVTLRDAISGHQQHSAEQRELEAERARIAAEKERVTLQRELAETYRENQIANVHSLIIQQYVKNDEPPNINWAASTDPTRETLIYDQNRQCIGLAYRGIYYHYSQFPEVCNR